MMGGTYLLTKLLLPALENAAVSQEKEGMSRGEEGLARVINVSSAGMYTVSGSGISKDLESRRVDPWDPTVV